ncbi:MAG: hypothetical protein HC837_05600 [Chloroflexaceae bacterium]|nr:hypothetical protein [Chloroflexaceae bacterium]
MPQVYGLPAPLTLHLETAAALGLLLVALGWVVFAIIDRRECILPGLPRRMLVLVLLLAWLALARDVLGVLFGLHPLLLALFAGGALLLTGMLFFPPPASGWIVVSAVLLGSGVRLACFFVEPMKSFSADALLTIERFGYILNDGVLRLAPWQSPPTSLPIAWMAYLPAYVLGLDVRLVNLLAELLIGVALAWAAIALQTNAGTPPRAALATVWNDDRVLLLWSAVFLLPAALHWSLTSIAPVPLALIALLLATLVSERTMATVLLMGLAGAASLLTMVVVPFILLYWLHRHGWWRTLLLAIIAVMMMALLCLLPVAFWLQEYLTTWYWMWMNVGDIVPHRYWAHPETWVELAGFQRPLWALGMGAALEPLQLSGNTLLTGVQVLGSAEAYQTTGTARLLFNLPQLLLAASMLLLTWYRARSMFALLSIITASLLFYLLFHPVSSPYVYTPVLVVALLWAIVWQYSTSPEPPKRIPRSVIALVLLLPLVGLPITLVNNRLPLPDHHNTSPFGVVSRLGVRVRDDDYRAMVTLMQEAGVQWQREELTWATIQRHRDGMFVWTAYPGYARGLYDYDRAIGIQVTAGIHVLALLSYHPAWFYGHEPAPLDAWIDDWGDFVYATVRRYGYERGWVKYWEVWNEPNLHLYGAHLGINTPEKYTQLLAVTRQAARAADPEAQLVLGGLASVWVEPPPVFNSDYRSYLSDVAQVGGLEHVDIVAIHPYRPSAPEDRLPRKGQLEDFRAELHAMDRLLEPFGSLPIWITEMGWSTYTGELGLDEETQAYYLVRMYLLALTHPSVEKVFWYELRNSTTDDADYEQPFFDAAEEQFHYGLLRRSYPLDPEQDDLRKPAFIAYRKLTQMLEGHTLQQVIADNTTPETAGVYWYRFTRPDQKEQPVDVFWRTGSVWPTFAADYGCAKVSLWEANGERRAVLPTIDGAVTIPEPPVGVPWYAKCE